MYKYIHTCIYIHISCPHTYTHTHIYTHGYKCTYECTQNTSETTAWQRLRGQPNLTPRSSALLPVRITTARRPDHIHLSALVWSRSTQFIVHASSKLGHGPPKRGHFSAILAGFSHRFLRSASMVEGISGSSFGFLCQHTTTNSITVETRTRVRSNRVSRKRPAKSNGTPAMDLRHKNIDLMDRGDSPPNDSWLSWVTSTDTPDFGFWFDMLQHR